MKEMQQTKNKERPVQAINNRGDVIQNLIKFSRNFFLNHFVWLKIAVLHCLLLVKKSDERLKTYRNKHLGQRCFIVALGPSLALDDLEKLKGEISFSLNSCFKLFDKTQWRPNYYVFQDSVAYEMWKDQIDHLDVPCVFFYNNLMIWNFGRDGIGFKSNEMYALALYIKKICSKYPTKIKFSTDIYKYIYTGGTTVISIIQIAVYMGFKEIYLLGADCDYTGPDLHHPAVEYDEDVLSKLDVSLLRNEGEKMIYSYAQYKIYLDRLGVKVYNATRGGKLEIFPRVNLDELVR